MNLDSPRMPGHILAMGGGGFMLEQDSPLDDFLLSLSGASRPRAQLPELGHPLRLVFRHLPFLFGDDFGHFDRPRANRFQFVFQRLAIAFQFGHFVLQG